MSKDRGIDCRIFQRICHVPCGRVSRNQFGKVSDETLKRHALRACEQKYYKRIERKEKQCFHAPSRRVSRNFRVSGRLSTDSCHVPHGRKSRNAEKDVLSYMRHGHSLCEYVSRNDMVDNMTGKIQGVRVEMTGEFLLWITEKSRLL